MPEPGEAPKYLEAQHPCDIVMKGGVTSGVIYPGAVCRLAGKYLFRSIGGTSAGAIAAAATAAAEYRRRKKSDEGFKRLAGLPRELGEKVNGRPRLLSLFQPNRATKPLFNVLITGLGKGRKWRMIPVALVQFWLASLLGLLPGAFFVFWGVRADAVSTALWIAASVTLLLVGPAAALFLAVLCRVRAIGKNRYGMCSGLKPEGSKGPEALTSWLASLLNEMAGKPASEPLTFGDLWGPQGRNNPDQDPDIRLEMMTTSLTYGRPYRLPFRDEEEEHFRFRKVDFDALFPKEVVEHLLKHSEDGERARKEPEFAAKLPPSAQIPVVVAARMSLSFPLLISAVPLFAKDRRRDDGEAIGVCWFSDGGIASNFPVHFFDGPLPRWPTFAVNLRSRKYEGPDAVDVYMPRTNNAGLLETWFGVDAEDGTPSVGGFLSAVLNCMQNWTDNTQLRMPGYRDRVVHVYLTDEEGGLNLNMPDEKIDRLSKRGAKAADELASRFEIDRPREARRGTLCWNNHRWVRYRSLMRLVEDLLCGVARAAESDAYPGAQPYPDFLAKAHDDPPSYEWDDTGQKKFVREATEKLLQIARDWREARRAKNGFLEKAPKPAPELRVRPRI